MPLLIFAAYTSAVTHNAFQWAKQPPKITSSPWGIWTLSNKWFLGLTRVTHLKSISTGLAVYVELKNVTNE